MGSEECEPYLAVTRQRDTMPLRPCVALCQEPLALQAASSQLWHDDDFVCAAVDARAESIHAKVSPL